MKKVKITARDRDYHTLTSGNSNLRAGWKLVIVNNSYNSSRYFTTAADRGVAICRVGLNFT